MKRSAGLKILICAAALVALGGCFDMLIPAVPSNLLDYLSPRVSSLLLGLLRALGGCLLAIGVTALFLVNGPLKRGEGWASWVILILIGVSEGITASQMWRFGSPYYWPLAFVALTVLGVVICRRTANLRPQAHPCA
jgi:hypothetical protein